MLSPELEKLLEKVGKNKYKLVVIAAKMAHQIEQEGKITDVKPLTLALKKLIEESKAENKSSV